MGKWLVTCRAFILFICSAFIQHFTLMSSISIFHHTWDGENKKSKYIEFITWLRNVKWTPERKKNPKWKNYQLIAHWALTLLSIVTAEKNEYFLYEQWIDNEFIQYKCRQIGRRKKYVQSENENVAHVTSFSVNIQPQTKYWKFSFVYFYKSKLAFRFATATVLSVEHILLTRLVSFTPQHCEVRTKAYYVLRPMPANGSNRNSMCECVRSCVGIEACLCVWCGHAAMRTKEMVRRNVPCQTNRTETNVCGGVRCKHLEMHFWDVGASCICFRFCVFFSSSTLRLCVFFSFLSLPSDRCRRRHLISFVRALVFLARLPGFMLRSRPAQAHINAHHFSMHLYRFAALQCARPHSPEFRVFSFYSRQFLVWNNTCESATQVPRT